jgi:hypothetical protein
MNEKLEEAQQSTNLCAMAIQAAHKEACGDHPVAAMLLRGLLEDARKIEARLSELALCMKEEA